MDIRRLVHSATTSSHGTSNGCGGQLPTPPPEAPREEGEDTAMAESLECLHSAPASPSASEPVGETTVDDFHLVKILGYVPRFPRERL